MRLVISLSLFLFIFGILNSGFSNSFAQSESNIPNWVKNNAGWWAEEIITDTDFASGLGFLMQAKIIKVANVEVDSQGSIVINDDIEIPKWIQNNAGWWADGQIDDKTFASGIEFLVNSDIISFKEKQKEFSKDKFSASKEIPENIKNKLDMKKKISKIKIEDIFKTHSNLKKDITLLVYMVGSDLENDPRPNAVTDYWATKDIKEMIAAKPSENINVILAAGGSKLAKVDATREIDFTKITFQQITSNGIHQIGTLGTKNIASDETLKSFLVASVRSFPAEKYVLIFWDHGFGSKGYGYDNISRNSLSLKELQNALSETKKETNTQFELIGFDACLMATYDVADKISNFANYLVSSQEDEPGNGWDYTAIISSLNQNSKQNGNELGKTIVNTYYNSTVSLKKVSYDPSKLATLSVVDLSKFNVVRNAYGELENAIISLKKDQLQKLSNALNNAERYGKNAKKDSGHLDLKDFSILLGNNIPNLKTKTDSMNFAIDSAVIHKKNGESKQNSNGLSFYLPRTNAVSIEESIDSKTRGEIDDTLELDESNNKLVEFYVNYLNSDTTAPEFNVRLDNNIIKGIYTDDDIFEINFYFTSETDDTGVLEIWSTEEWDAEEFEPETINFEWDGYEPSLCNSKFCYPVNAEWELGETNDFAYIPVLVYSSNPQAKPVEGSLVYDIIGEKDAELIGFLPESANSDLFSKQILPLNNGDIVQILATYLNMNTGIYTYDPAEMLEVDADFRFDWAVYDWGPLDVHTEICDFSDNCKRSNDVFTLDPVDIAQINPNDIIPLNQNDPLNPEDYEYPYDYDYSDTNYEWGEYDDDYEIISIEKFCFELHEEFDEELGEEEVDNVCQDIRFDFGNDIDTQTAGDVIIDIWDYIENGYADTISINEFCVELHEEFDEELETGGVANICLDIKSDFGNDINIQTAGEIWWNVVDYLENESTECEIDELGYVICIPGQCGYSQFEEFVCDGEFYGEEIVEESTVCWLDESWYGVCQGPDDCGHTEYNEFVCDGEYSPPS